MELSLKEIVQAAKGTLVQGDGEFVVKGISTDTRTIEKGMLFVALSGESFDGHKFVDVAEEKGAGALLVQKEVKSSLPVIMVKDTRLALGDIAAFYMAKLNIPTVAVTGSVGKTTTKDMIAAVLGKHFNTGKTRGNHNNDIGVPLTVFSYTPENTAAVVEMGMNHFNEISYLTNMVKPDIAIITNVGVSHIEYLGSREGILKAKCEIFEGLKKGGKAIVNGDNDMLITLKGTRDDIVFFGLDPSFDIYADNIKDRGIEGTDCTIHKGDKSFDVSIHIPGRHMVSNALAAAGAGFELGMTCEEIKQGIEEFVPTGMRMDIIKGDRLTIINDAYNSNPVSAKAAIDVLAAAKGKKCAVLGDMYELGSFGPSLHREVGEYAAKKGIDEIIAVGEISLDLYEGAKSVRENGVHYFKTQEEMLEHITERIQENMTVLVKASRGMKLEKTTEKLRGEFNV